MNAATQSQATKNTKPIYVYIAHQKGSDFFKVGYSQDPEGRVSSFHTGNPNNIEIIGKVPTTDKLRDERRVRLALQGWYRREWCIADRRKALKALKVIAPTA